jgi:hypothetical protein
VFGRGVNGLAFFANLMNSIFDQLVRPFGGSAAWAMLSLSIVVGIAMLLLFKVSTNQQRLTAVKRPLLGLVYELGLFQDNLGVLLKIQWDLARANLRYLLATLPALVAILIPLVPILVQLDSRFAHRPFQPQDRTLVTVQVAEGQTDLLDDLALTASAGVAVETLPVRDFQQGIAVWRVRVLQSGRHELTVTAPGRGSWTKKLEADGGLPRLATRSERAGWHHALLNPAEPPLPKDGPLDGISLELPERRTRYAGVAIPSIWFMPRWLVAFTIFSLAFGIALKDVFHVKM